MVRVSAKMLLNSLIVLVVVGGIGWYGWQHRDFTKNFSKTLGDILPFTRDISMPDPLHGPQGGKLATLTADGVFTGTNQQRQDNGVKPLTHNTVLDAAARNKLEDMFAHQYFEHISPTGKGPGDLADAVHYEYAKIGENLALGNFASDDALIQAWMNSPGHRANILNTGYQEIGIAVGRGVFDGQETWIAVQEFGTPISVCPTPDANTKDQITQNQTTLTTLSSALENPTQDRDATTKKIQDLMSQAQSLVDQGKAKISDGNAKIEEGNKIYADTGDTDKAQPYWDEGKQLQDAGRNLIDQAKKLQQEAIKLDAELKAGSGDYNSQVTQYNSLQTETQKFVDTYNSQVQAFNACLKALE